MSHRWVARLEYARQLAERPGHIPASRPRGKKAAGLRYEKQMAQALPQAERGVWFEFRDLNGPGCCQVDLLMPRGSALVVLEAKYTWVAEGHTQIEKLYRPVVELATGRPVIGLVVCKVLVPRMPVRVFQALDEALDCAAGGAPCALHWLGAGPVPGSAASRGRSPFGGSPESLGL